MQIHQQQHVSYTQAKAILDYTWLLAKQEELAIAACVIDANGRLIAKMVMDGCSHIADALIEQKASTALLGLSSQDFGVVMQQQDLLKDSMLKLEQLTFIGGGFPLQHESQIIGAFAVGGALVDQDIALAKSVLEHFA